MLTAVRALNAIPMRHHTGRHVGYEATEVLDPDSMVRTKPLPHRHLVDAKPSGGAMAPIKAGLAAAPSTSSWASAASYLLLAIYADVRSGLMTSSYRLSIGARDLLAQEGADSIPARAQVAADKVDHNGQRAERGVHAGSAS